MPVRTLVIFLALSLVAYAGLLKPDVDFSNYDVPLHEQVVNRIEAKVSARLGKGTHSRDRYFIIPFAYENDGNDPEFSHSFMTVIRVFADDNQPRLTAGLKTRRYKNREFVRRLSGWPSTPSPFSIPYYNDEGSCIFDKEFTRPKRGVFPH